MTSVKIRTNIFLYFALSLRIKKFWHHIHLRLLKYRRVMSPKRLYPEWL